jgi:hypothetical protein
MQLKCNYSFLSPEEKNNRTSSQGTIIVVQTPTTKNSICNGVIKEF